MLSWHEQITKKRRLEYLSDEKGIIEALEEEGEDFLVA